MPLAFSTNAFKQNTLIESIEAIGQVGYRAVELMADLHHAYPLTFSAERRRETKKRLADLGLAVSNVNAFTHFVAGDTYHPTWIEDDAKLVDVRVQHTIRSIELAQEFGAKTVSIQPGGPLIGRSISRNEAYERFATALARCVPTAQACGVTIAVEPEPGLLIERAGEYMEFKQRHFAAESTVRMNCDVGHLFCVGDDPADVIRRFPHDIAHVHLEDIGQNRVHQHLTPGRGVIDFGSIFAALEQSQFDGWTTVELYPFETSAKGVAASAMAHLSRFVSRSES
ncbi:MAG: sugar phosphate isomerase/epimerase [Tepidisphaeraceae bacterium]